MYITSTITILSDPIVATLCSTLDLTENSSGRVSSAAKSSDDQQCALPQIEINQYAQKLTQTPVTLGKKNTQPQIDILVSQHLSQYFKSFHNYS